MKYYCIELNCNNKICYQNYLYGSRKCLSCSKKEYYKNNPKTNPKYIDGRTLIKKYCKDCDKEINWQTFFKGRGRCHSCNTIYRHQIEHFTAGNKNGNWQNGISKLPYSFGFNDELKEQIRKRDNYQCQNCGIIEEEYIIVFGERLTIHHIDYNKMNCNDDNLITLCNSCNFRANYNRDYWQEYYNSKQKRYIDVRNKNFSSG